jgi:hypothetical protein
VLVLALSSDESFLGEHIFSAEAVTYLDASGSSIPYITAEFRASDFDRYQDFTVGDRAIFPALSMLNTNKSQAKKYFNGPLTPNTRYTVFQRFLSDKVSPGNFYVSSCSNTGSIRDHSYWTSRKNSLELMSYPL